MLWWSKSLLVALILLIFHSHSHFVSSYSVQDCRLLRTALLNLNTRYANETTDCCTWDGVECDSKTGHVTSLTIFQFDLNGTITSRSSLFSLIHLQSLSIVNFGVEIGSDAFDALTRNLTKLQEIIFFGVNLSSVPPASLINLPSSLTKLDIIGCKLTGELAQNTFHFPNLRELSLSDNHLQGPIPPWIYALPNLELLEISSNNLSGTLELQELSKLKKLYDINLSYNNNLSVTNNCTNCTFDNLSYFLLSSCILTEFPHFLRSSKHLVVLDLSNNQIQGIVPKWLNELKDLQILDLRSNFFFGPLPFFSSNFSFFSVSKNQFSGEIPSSIFNITSSNVVLDLSYNNLIGRIPPFIGNVENLFVLDLRSNNLSGPIPESLFVENSSLETLNLNGNQLKGQLPRSLVHCRKLELLDLGNNQFNDTFPDWLESLPHLQVLVLRANKFHGSIRNLNRGLPFQELRIMDLSHNDFTGALPTKYFDNFEAMKIATSRVPLSYMGDKLNAYFISGYYKESVSITMKGNELELERIQNILITIDLSSNKFTGEIPELLGNLKSLKGLNLSHNMLEWLDLSSNKLVGKIPAELVDINGLQFFNVSHNRLQGPIPVGKQFNTFGIESFVGNSDLCGFPLLKSCGGGAAEPPEPRLDQDEDGEESIIRFGSNLSVVMMGYASGLVIGISMGYMLLSSKGKLHWLSGRILEEIEYRRVMRPKRRNARRSQRK